MHCSIMFAAVVVAVVGSTGFASQVVNGSFEVPQPIKDDGPDGAGMWVWKYIQHRFSTAWHRADGRAPDGSLYRDGRHVESQASNFG
jgi:hypothetical protein